MLGLVIECSFGSPELAGDGIADDGMRCTRRYDGDRRWGDGCLSLQRAAEHRAGHIRRAASRIKSPPDGGLFGFRPDQVGMDDGGLAVTTLSFSRLARTGFS
ncbi:hypothetical protein [Mesorhizobium sp. WSM3859]|uniref:hypothetical protein n=1 Tax=Mesorhizobium sp. WSM3859 TaxID=2029402 RepID=UPI0015971099|nr:hypothetical protein [Mesorhizobium sp. WSM3859]